MAGTWTPKTNYFIKLPKVRLMEVLDEIIVSIIGYDPTKVWTLSDVCRGIKYLSKNEIAINIQICNSAWIDVKLQDGSRINARGVMNYINQEDFDLAKYYFQVDEFLTQSEYDLLINVYADRDGHLCLGSA